MSTVSERFPIRRWREILIERAEESAAAVRDLEGVVDVVIGGSVGRGEPWPYSDIDLIPIVSELGDHERLLRARRRQLVEEWAASGWTHVLDVGRLVVTTDETQLLHDDIRRLPKLLEDPRLLHATDKVVHGRGDYSASKNLVVSMTAARFDLDVRRARFDQWMSIIERRLARAEQLCASAKAEEAMVTAQVAGPLAAAALEAWSQQEGSMTKFATRFEQLAVAHARPDLAADITAIACSGADDVARDISMLPSWLGSRVELSYAGRREVGEEVTVLQNRRDQVLLFLGRPGLPTQGEWLRRKHPDVDAYLVLVHGVVDVVKELRP